MCWRGWAGLFTPIFIPSEKPTLTRIDASCLLLSNFERFKCECLKVAVLKNKWLAQHLGGNQNILHLLLTKKYSVDMFSVVKKLYSGDMFSVVFKYEVPEVVDQGLK